MLEIARKRHKNVKNRYHNVGETAKIVVHGVKGC